MDALTYKTPGQHAAAPGGLLSKGRQGRQAAGLVAANPALKVPAGHGRQASTDVVAVTLLRSKNSIAGKGAQAVKCQSYAVPSLEHT